MNGSTDTFDKIMELAERDHQVALSALQEALVWCSEVEQKRVLDYLESEE